MTTYPFSLYPFFVCARASLLSSVSAAVISPTKWARFILPVRIYRQSAATAVARLLRRVLIIALIAAQNNNIRTQRTRLWTAPRGGSHTLSPLRKSAGTQDSQKFQITNHKYQTNHNDQNSKFQTCLLFWSLYIGIWDLFVIWCLGFDILRCFNTPILQYSSTLEELAPLPAKPLYSDLA